MYPLQYDVDSEAFASNSEVPQAVRAWPNSGHHLVLLGGASYICDSLNNLFCNLLRRCPPINGLYLAGGQHGSTSLMIQAVAIVPLWPDPLTFDSQNCFGGRVSFDRDLEVQLFLLKLLKHRTLCHAFLDVYSLRIHVQRFQSSQELRWTCLCSLRLRIE